MNASELRDRTYDILITKDQVTLPVQVIILFEIAAQLADLNEFLRRPEHERVAVEDSMR